MYLFKIYFYLISFVEYLSNALEKLSFSKDSSSQILDAKIKETKSNSLQFLDVT
jgi:hypothetical protein